MSATSHYRVWVAGGSVLAGLLLVVSAAPAHAASLPSTGEWFGYDYNIYLNNGQGNYSGYSEQQTSHYRYTVQSVSGSNVTMAGSGNWAWSNSTGTTQSGSWAQTFSFDSSSRQYVSGFDVLGNYTNPYVWFWVPPGLAVGKVVSILDEQLTVTSLDSTVWLGNFPPTPRMGEELSGSGSFVRNDVYGYFDASYTDQYWFDPSTGFVIAELYNEQDNSPFGAGSFSWQEQVFTTEASFPITFDIAQLLLVYVGIPLVPIALFVLGYTHRDGPRRVRRSAPASGRIVARRIRRVRKLGASTMPPGTSYAPFLRSAVRRAIGLRDPVYVAASGTTVRGLYTYDRIDHIGSIVATDPAVIHTFLSMRKPGNCFIELPSGTPNSLPAPAKELGSFDIYELSPVVAVPYDAETVRPFQPSDLPDLLRITRKVYSLSQDRQLVEALADGDLAFVAVVDGSRVGYALATVGDGGGLLYGLVVDPEARGLGIGTDLVAARLSALAALGVPKARMEVMEGNAPPRHLAAKFGFQKVATMVYYNLKPTAQIDADARPSA